MTLFKRIHISRAINYTFMGPYLGKFIGGPSIFLHVFSDGWWNVSLISTKMYDGKFENLE